MRYLRLALYAIAGLVVVAVGVFVLIAATFDPNAYKNDLAALTKDKTQRTLTIDGDIGLTFFPKIGVKLDRTTLSERGSDAQFAAFDRARVALALLPLLSGRVVVDQIVLEGLRATVVRRKDGSTNLDDLIARGERDAPVQPPAARPAPARPVALNVQGIRIADAALEFRDEQAGARYTVSDLLLETGPIAPGVATEFKLAARVRADRPALDLNCTAQGRLQADLDKAAFALADLRGTVQGKHGADALRLTIETPRLEAVRGAASAKALVWTLETQGPGRETAATVRVSDLAITAKAAHVAELALDLNGKQGSNAVQGRLTTPVQADLEQQTVALPALSGQFEIRAPAAPVQPLTIPLSGRLGADLRNQAVDAVLSARIDQTNLKAAFGLNGFARPRVRFDATLDRLDLDRYASKPAAAQGTAASGPAGARAQTPIDLSPLKSLNLSGRARIGELVAARVRLSNVQFDVRAQGGKLEIDPLVADLYQGRVRSAIAVDASTNRFSVRHGLSGVAVGALLKDALAQDLLAGRGDLALQLTAAGATGDALIRSLSGEARLKLQDGAIKGIDLAQRLRDAKRALSPDKEAEHAAAAGEKTAFSELAASFTIRNGRARNEDLSVKSPFLRLTATGEVDIAGGALDYLAKASVVATREGQGGKELADLAGLTVPVRISGPLSAPRFKLDLAAAFAGATQSKLEEKKAALKSRLQDKLLGGKPAQPAAEEPTGGSESAAPEPPKAEEQLRKKLKELLR